MNDKVMKAVKIIIPLASIAAGLATNWLNEKEFDAKVAKKVNETLANSNGKES